MDQLPQIYRTSYPFEVQGQVYLLVLEQLWQFCMDSSLTDALLTHTLGRHWSLSNTPPYAISGSVDEQKMLGLVP